MPAFFKFEEKAAELTKNKGAKPHRLDQKIKTRITALHKLHALLVTINVLITMMAAWPVQGSHGDCQSCIRYYSEKDLPAEVRHQVKSTYYDYTITSVKEVSHNKTMAYLITVEDEKSWKVIRVVEGEMDVWEDHGKN